MRHSLYANENADEQARDAHDRSLVEVGVVDTVIAPDSGIVRVRTTDGSHVVAEVGGTPPSSRYLPSVDTPVRLLRRRGKRPLVIDTFPSTDADTIELRVGERVIGHEASDTQLHFTEDGALDIYRDGDDEPIVTIDDNGVALPENVVTDVTTQTDGDGHVTDVTLTTTDVLSR